MLFGSQGRIKTVLRVFLLCLAASSALDCWTKDIPPDGCCPMNDDTYPCFSGPFTHRRCCTSPTPVLKGCSCSSFYLEEVAAFLRSIQSNSIGLVEVNSWKWKYHPKNCSLDFLLAHLARASKRRDECWHLEKLHFLVLCGLQTGWWQDNLAIDEFWNQIMTSSINLLRSSCDGLLTPQEAFYNYRRFHEFYLSNSMKLADFGWHRQRVKSSDTYEVDPTCGTTFRRPTVHCAVMGRLPEETALARSIMETWGKDCDSIGMYVAKLPVAATTWQDRRSGIQVMNLAKKYPVLLRHPDQIGHFNFTGDEESEAFLKGKFQSANLIRKTLAMWHWVGTQGPRSDFVCRLDPDTLFLVYRFRRYVHRHCLRKDSMVYLGQVLHYMQKHLGAFPDGGAGICLPWRATQKFAALLEDRVHLYVGGDQATGLPDSCQMLPGHLDDMVTGLCFKMMNLLPHHALQTSLGQYLFNGQVMPQDATETLNGSFQNWSDFRRLHHLFQCESHCPNCSCSSLNPEFWIDERRAITFHRYKNATGMRLAYHRLRAL